MDRVLEFVQSVEEVAAIYSRICQSVWRSAKMELERRGRELHPALSLVNGSINWSAVQKFERHVALSERTGRAMSNQRMMEEPWEKFQVLVEGRCLAQKRPGWGSIGTLEPQPSTSKPGTGCITANLNNETNTFIWSIALPYDLVEGFDARDFLPPLPVANRISSFLEAQLRVHAVLRHKPTAKMATIIDYDEAPIKITWRPPDRDLSSGPSLNVVFDSNYWHCPGGTARAAHLKALFRFIDISRQYPQYPIRIILSEVSLSIADSNDDRRLASSASSTSSTHHHPSSSSSASDWQLDIKRHLFCPYLRWA